MAKHVSIPTGAPIEIVNVSPLNPLISKCQIKVCYVGNEPNRNGSVITKATAVELANTLPGSPIVGFFNKESNDFEEHNRNIKIPGYTMEDATQPYGFVDLNAKVWFQTFADDGVEHEYLVTEGYLWTGQYPEAKRVIEKGNNQSMELDENSLQGAWAFDDNLGTEFFIINEAIISKLCILGEEFEPCFEGATISKTFSLDDDFNQRIFKLMQEVKKLKGGDTPMEDEKNLEKEKVLEEEAVNENTPDEPAAEPEMEEEQAAEESQPEEEAEEEAPEEEGEPEEKESEENEGEEIQFSLSDFQDLTERFSTLEANYAQLQTKVADLEAANSALEATNASLTEANAALTEFKNATERAEKQRMIDSFYMLSDEDKADVITNIDSYSIDDIEAKLSVICVRNKLDLSEKSEDKQGDTTFSLDSIDDDDDTSAAPAWVTALQHTKNNDR